MWGMTEEQVSTRRPANVVYQTAEDGLTDTIKPRLMQAKADCNHVYTIHEHNEALTLNDVRLEYALQQLHPTLVILDPIQAYLGANVDMHRANEIRPVMQILAQAAQRYNCAVVLIGHMNKKAGDKSMYRGLGSIDLAAAARSVLLMARDPQVILDNIRAFGFNRFITVPKLIYFWSPDCKYSRPHTHVKLFKVFIAHIPSIIS